MEGWGLVVFPAAFAGLYVMAHVLRRILPPRMSIVVGNVIYLAGWIFIVLAGIGFGWMGLTVIGHGLAWLIFPVIYAFCVWLVFLGCRELRLVLHNVHIAEE